MNREDATRLVEERYGRRLHVDPVHASVAPAFYTMVGLSVMTIFGIGFIPWWGTIIAAAVVGGTIFTSTKQKNDQMLSELRQLMRQDE